MLLTLNMTKNEKPPVKRLLLKKGHDLIMLLVPDWKLLAVKPLIWYPGMMRSLENQLLYGIVSGFLTAKCALLRKISPQKKID